MPTLLSIKLKNIPHLKFLDTDNLSFHYRFQRNHNWLHVNKSMQNDRFRVLVLETLLYIMSKFEGLQTISSTLLIALKVIQPNLLIEKKLGKQNSRSFGRWERIWIFFFEVWYKLKKTGTTSLQLKFQKLVIFSTSLRPTKISIFYSLWVFEVITLIVKVVGLQGQKYGSNWLKKWCSLSDESFLHFQLGLKDACNYRKRCLGRHWGINIGLNSTYITSVFELFPLKASQKSWLSAGQLIFCPHFLEGLCGFSAVMKIPVS